MTGYVPLGEYKVEYLDGRTETCKSHFLGIARIEERWPDPATRPMATVLAFGAWCYLGEPGGDFEKWAAQVHMVEFIDSPQAKARPTKAARGAA